jgi:hypothetical protein
MKKNILYFFLSLFIGSITGYAYISLAPSNIISPDVGGILTGLFFSTISLIYGKRGFSFLIRFIANLQ